MLVGDHKILKITFFLFILLFFYYLFIFSPQKCTNLNFIKNSTIALPILNFGALISSFLLFKKDSLLIKISLFSFSLLIFILNLIMNILTFGKCSYLLISLVWISGILPFVLMLFW